MSTIREDNGAIQKARSNKKQIVSVWEEGKCAFIQRGQNGWSNNTNKTKRDLNRAANFQHCCSISCLFLLQAIMRCLVTLPSAPHSPPTTHTQVCHPWRCEWSLYGRCWAAQGGIWSFSLSRWNVNTPVAWICQMSTWYFKVASWLRFFFASWGGRQGCFALGRHTHKHACTHTHCWSPQTYSESGNTVSKRPEGPHTCAHTDTKAFLSTCILWSHTHTPNTLSFSHLASCLVYTQCNGIW